MLVELNEHLALIETEDESECRRASYGSNPQPRSVEGVIRDLRAQIRGLEERIDDARAALE